MRRTLAFLLLLGCSSTVSPGRCVPGASMACVCPGVGAGAQVCAADGASFGVCVCGVDAGVDAAGDAPSPGDVPLGMDVVIEDRPDVWLGTDPVPLVDRLDVVTVPDTGPRDDRPTAGDNGADVVATGGCYTEDGPAALCPMRRHLNDATTPSWRVTAITIREPAVLASPLILNVLNPPLRDGKFLWGLSFNLQTNTFRTGSLNPMFTRGVVGVGLMDGVFAYHNNNAPPVGRDTDPARWNPLTGSFVGTGSVTTNETTSALRLPVFNDDRSILLELPLANARLSMVPVSMDRGCIGLGQVRAGRYNECSSGWETDLGGTVEAAITVTAARGITVSALNQTLCQLLSGTNCDMPQMMWTRQPNAMVGSEPAYRLVARFAAISANIQ